MLSQIALPDLSTYVDWGLLALALTLSGVLNRFVEVAVRPIFEKMGWDKTYILHVALVLGVILAFVLPVNIFKPPLINVIPGTALTGILMGAGANFLHDFLSKPSVQVPIPPPAE